MFTFFSYCLFLFREYMFVMVLLLFHCAVRTVLCSIITVVRLTCLTFIRWDRHCREFLLRVSVLVNTGGWWGRGIPECRWQQSSFSYASGILSLKIWHHCLVVIPRIYSVSHFRYVSPWALRQWVRYSPLSHIQISLHEWFLFVSGTGIAENSLLAYNKVKGSGGGWKNFKFSESVW